ncbi:MAG TPA: hypothetical protein PKD58_04045 [Candidatus Sumerlaeota bacterium]|nr:hypothetical protein [Candidatus Sumerlaeota bacterium]HNM46560.1 hypothetical protein [Candidatus Sumerlaeota bacterium]
MALIHGTAMHNMVTIGGIAIPEQDRTVVALADKPRRRRNNHEQ